MKKYFCMNRCFKNNRNGFMGKILNYDKAPRPESINWRNLNKHGISEFCRYLICFVVIILIFMLSSLILISLENYKSSL